MSLRISKSAAVILASTNCSSSRIITPTMKSLLTKKNLSSSIMSTITKTTTISKRSFHTTLSTKKGDLYKYQDELPPLPVPDLAQTLNLYKKSIIPYYPNGENDENFKNYCKIIDNFGENEGKILQSKLLEFSKGKRNWLAEFWDNYAYLEYRDSVTPFSSYFFSHKELNNEIGKDQLLKSSALTFKILQFMKQIEDESLEPELIKNSPFCMESFKWMFNNSRIPIANRDKNIQFNPKENRFMIVISNDRFYKLYHHDENDNILSPFKIYTSLLNIKNDSLSKSSSEIVPLGILTSANRDVWAKSYQDLIDCSPVNEISLNDISASSFVLCLDNDTFPNTIKDKSRNCWHGNGTNRWFDKPIEIFVAANGSSGFLGEHSKMDGTPTLRMNDWVISQISKMNLEDFKESDGNYKIIFNSTEKDSRFKELQFDINPTIQKSVETELIQFDKTINSLDIHVFQNFGVGKNQIKNLKVSPDAFVQMLLQLAYFKMTGTLRPTYESASTRRFFGGRTETCRSVSVEALNFVKTWEDGSKSIDEKAKSFYDAAKQHVGYISKASAGEGCDRHLFGLKQMYSLLSSSSSESTKLHDIFTNPMFNYSSHWFLSTSQLSSNNFNGYGWSPVVPEGLGLAYMINNDFTHVNVTAFKDNQFGIKPEVMGYYLNLSINELNDVLTKANLVKAKL